MRALAGEASVANDMRFERRDLDFVVFADQRHVAVAQRAAAPFAIGRPVVTNFVGIFGKTAVMWLVPGLRPARTGVLALLLLIRRWRLRRSARRFLRSLQPQNQINQLVLAQPLQISPVHKPDGFRDRAVWQGRG